MRPSAERWELAKVPAGKRVLNDKTSFIHYNGIKFEDAQKRRGEFPDEEKGYEKLPKRKEHGAMTGAIRDSQSPIELRNSNPLTISWKRRVANYKKQKATASPLVGIIP